MVSFERRGTPRVVVGLVSAGHFLSHFYLLAFPPLFPLLKAEFGLTNTQVGILFSLLFLMPTVLQLPVGEVVDRTGAKRIFVVGIAVTAFGTMLTVLANSYFSLLAFVLVAGIGQSAFHPADFALLETVTDETNRGRGYGTHTFAGFLGFAAGPVVAGSLGLRYGWRVALVGLGAVGVVYAVLAQLSLKPIHQERRLRDDPDVSRERDALSNWSLVTDRRILLTFVFFVTLTITGTGIQSFTIIYLKDVIGVSGNVANTTLTANLTATALGVLAGGVLADRFDIYAVLLSTIAIAASLVFVIVVGVVPSTVAAVFVVFTVLGVFHGIALPSRDSLVSSFSTDDSAGKSFGFAYTGASVGAFVAPIVLGVASDTVNNRAMYALIGLFYGVAALTVVVLSLRSDRRHVASTNR